MDSGILIQNLKRYALFACGVAVIVGSAFISPWLFAAVVVAMALTVWALWLFHPNRRG